MDRNRRSNILTIVGVSGIAMAICIFGATFLSNYFGKPDKGDSTASSTNTQDTINPDRTWKTNILFNIPTDVVGGAKEVNVTELIPYYSDAFGEDNVKCYKDKNNPYLFKITVASPLGDNSRKYEEHLVNDALYTYSCDDYYNEVILKGYVFDHSDYRLMISPSFNNYVDSLFIRYIPNGENWPSETIYSSFASEAYSMIPGMKLEEVPIVGPVTDSCLTFEYNSSNSEILLYKQTLIYLGYEEINGMFTNTLNNTIMIDMSVENQISITAPVK